jgi:uncharacterized membrane protein
MVESPEEAGSGEPNASVASFVKYPIVLFGVVLLITTVCKILSINSRELWLDETYSAFVTKLSFANMLHYAAGDVHPPLFYLLLKLWIGVVGDAPGQMRLFSVVVNFFSCVAMFVFAKRMLGSRLGAFAAALFALSPTVFVYSLEIRMYMLMTFLFIWLLMIHWLIVIEGGKDRWLVIAYGVLAALLFYVHYIDIFIILGLFVHWLITTGLKRQRLVRMLAAAALTIVLILPGVPMLLHQFAGKSELTRALTQSRHNPEALSYVAVERFTDQTAGMRVVLRSLASAAGFYPAESQLLLLLLAIPLAVGLGGIVYLATAKSDRFCQLLVVLTVSISAGMIVLHLTNSRYLIALIPVLVLAIGRALQYWTNKPRWRILGLTAGALILCIYAAGFYQQAVKPHGRPWQNVVSAVQQGYRPGDTVIFDALYAQVPFDYFAHRMDFHPTESGFPVSIYDWWNSQGFKGWGSPVIMKPDLDKYVTNLSASGPKTVWLVHFEARTYDTHYALMERLRQIGQADDVALPADPEDTRPTGATTLRLIRITIN